MAKTGLKRTDEISDMVEQAKSGNGFAFTALWDYHIEQLRAFIRSRFKGIDEYTAEDICSRSFEKAFRQIHTYDAGKSQFFTWLCTIAKNTGLDHIDAEERVHPKDAIVYIDEETMAGSVIPDTSADALNSLIDSENEEEREKCVERLPDLYREVARKRLIEGMKYEEIAESMGLELNTVKTRIRRSKQIIDKMRADEEGRGI